MTQLTDKYNWAEPGLCKFAVPDKRPLTTCAIDSGTNRIAFASENCNLYLSPVEKDSPTCIPVKCETINSITFHKKWANMVFLATDEGVVVLDDRSNEVAFKFTDNREEVNEVTIHWKGMYMAAPDDAGEICVYDLDSRKQFKRLSRGHSNIVSSACFRPRKPYDLITGGMDQQVILWDISRGRHTAREQFTAEATDGGLLNPPMIHCVDVNPSGTYALAAAEDGEIKVLGLPSGKKSRYFATASVNAHLRGATQVRFGVSSNEGDAAEHLVFSTGNDMRLKAWYMNEDESKDSGGDEDYQISWDANCVANVVLGEKPNALQVHSMSNGLLTVMALSDGPLELRKFSAVS
eukprot:Clim_evm69s172 gene=Clim_evmTU69s172